AYVVLLEDQQPEALKPWLAQRLPEHMLPAAILALAALPLTTNGKLDRRALPLPDAQALSRQDFVPPQGDTETTLATLWAELLRQPQVGRLDQFFDLGGHSLLAISLVERLRQHGLVLEVSALFSHPQLADMALQVQRADQAVDAMPPVPPVGIPDQAQAITPAMLPMLDLTFAQIDTIVAQVDGGAANVQDIYPLAPLQQGILFHHLLHQQGDVYLSPVVLGFADQAQLDSFSAALQQVIHRHDILRTSVAWQGLPEPVQVVWRSAPLAIEQLPPTDASALAQLLDAVDARRHRIDLRRAPMLRAVAQPDPAYADGTGRWLLALCVHHLTLDHSSLEIVLQEVHALRDGQTALLRPPLPFRNQVWRAHESMPVAAHEAFFQAQLGDVQQPTAPFDLLDVQGDARGVREARLPLPAALSAAVRTQARAAGVSPASLLHLAWGLLLARTSPGHDHAIVFGTVLFGRMRAGAGADRALGLFINTLPLRLDVGQPGVADALRATHQRLAALLHHEHAPLALAQRCSGVAAPAPLFTTLFNYRYTPAAAHDGPQAIDMVWGEERTGYPLALAVDDDGQGFSLALQAVATLAPERLARLVQHTLQQLVRALAHAPATPCAALDLLDADELTRLASFNPPPLAYPRHALLHGLVRQQVRATPDALAVVDGELQLSYAELDVRSDALAQRIVAALAGCAVPEPVVAVALPRSADTVVALLAILKAGAVYLPLDLAYPAQRLQYLLDDAGAQ
ncbi:MAG: condensation domain-containing protein, partial [Pseudomonadota bacterium]